MKYEELNEIEDLEHRIDRAKRRGMNELVAQREQELTETRRKLIERLIRRRDSIEDSTYAQRNRREEFDDLIDEQQAALKDDTRALRESDGGLTIGDLIGGTAT